VISEFKKMKIYTLDPDNPAFQSGHSNKRQTGTLGLRVGIPLYKRMFLNVLSALTSGAFIVDGM
jgi:hypothetical protein